MAADVTVTLNWVLFSDPDAYRIIYLKIWCLVVDQIIEEHFPFM